MVNPSGESLNLIIQWSLNRIHTCQLRHISPHLLEWSDISKMFHKKDMDINCKPVDVIQTMLVLRLSSTLPFVWQLPGLKISIRQVDLGEPGTYCEVLPWLQCVPDLSLPGNSTNTNMYNLTRQSLDLGLGLNENKNHIFDYVISFFSLLFD